MNTQCTAIIFIRYLPSTTLPPRGETLFHLLLINILEKFEDFSSTIWKYSKTFKQQPETIQRLFRLQNCLSRKSPISPKYSKTFRATTSSNQQQEPAAAISSSINQQQQSAAATSSGNQHQQSAFILPAASTQSTPTSVSYHYGSSRRIYPASS